MCSFTSFSASVSTSNHQIFTYLVQRRPFLSSCYHFNLKQAFKVNNLAPTTSYAPQSLSLVVCYLSSQRSRMLMQKRPLFRSIRGNNKTADGRCEKEVKRRIALAKSAYHEMSRVLNSRNFNMQTRKIIFHCYIWSTLLYVYEKKKDKNKTMERILEAFEMWAYRRMLRVSWTEYKTNEEVLNMANTTRSFSESWWQLPSYTLH